jgi:hypothetical protein
MNDIRFPTAQFTHQSPKHLWMNPALFSQRQNREPIPLEPLTQNPFPLQTDQTLFKPRRIQRTHQIHHLTLRPTDFHRVDDMSDPNTPVQRKSFMPQKLKSLSSVAWEFSKSRSRFFTSIPPGAEKPHKPPPAATTR